jgi:hypothetical protein
LGGKAGVEFRKDYHAKPNGDFLKSRYVDQFADVKIENIVVEGSDLTKPISINYAVEFSSVAQSVGDKVYLPVMVEKFFLENPLKSIERTFPVQFPYPVKSEYILNLTIPDGYAVEYIPEPTKLVIEGGPTFTISSSKTNEKEIQVRMMLLIKEHTYAPEYYTPLRNFFSGLVEKQDLQIVLKKN